MFRSFLGIFGLRRRRRSFASYAAFGPIGLLPIAGYLAYRYRDQIGHLLHEGKAKLMQAHEKSTIAQDKRVTAHV